MTQQLFGSRLIIIYSVCATNLSTLQYRSPPSRSVSGPVLSQRSEAEGWQPSFSDRSFKKKKTAAKPSPLLICIFIFTVPFIFILPQFSCQSSKMTLHSWDDGEKRVCGRCYVKSLHSCTCVCACCLMKESQTKMVMFLNVSMVNIKHWCVFGGLLFQLCKTAPLMTLSLRKAKWQQRPETRSMENSDFYLWILNSRNQFSSTI